MDGHEQHDSQQIDNLLIVGVGLIGGSIALAARKNGVAKRVIGVGRNEERLATAQEAGIIDEFSTSVEPVADRCSFAVVCTPVDRIVKDVRSIGKFAQPGTLITDAGSTKERICEDLADVLPEGINFIGSHPLAGSEKTGFEAADEDLFVGRTTVITPPHDGVASSTVGETEIRRVTNFWDRLGAEVVQLTASEHDECLAHTSHLPHLVASALTATVRKKQLPLAATGFRDTTRIAAGDPELWRAILASNSEHVVQAIKDFREHLDAFYRAVSEGDTEQLQKLLKVAKTIRDEFDDLQNQ